MKAEFSLTSPDPEEMEKIGTFENMDNLAGAILFTISNKDNEADWHGAFNGDLAQAFMFIVKIQAFIESWLTTEPALRKEFLKFMEYVAKQKAKENGNILSVGLDVNGMIKQAMELKGEQDGTE